MENIREIKIKELKDLKTYHWKYRNIGYFVQEISENVLEVRAFELHGTAINVFYCHFGIETLDRLIDVGLKVKLI